MVVEDERAVREFVSTALTRAGYRVLTAHDGHDALTRAAAHAAPATSNPMHRPLVTPILPSQDISHFNTAEPGR